MREVSLHKTEILLDKEKLTNILKQKELTFKELWRRIADENSKFGLDLTYKGLMHLCSNRASWKLLYAYAIIDVLDINIDDIFYVSKVDTEKKAREKEEWKDKYQKKK